MESGLEDRNNRRRTAMSPSAPAVSMESGLEDRNNSSPTTNLCEREVVSMESGLEDRNNKVNGLTAVPAAAKSQWSPA